MGKQRKRPGIKDIMAMAKAAETGISEQKKQEIFESIVEARKDAADALFMTVPTEEKTVAPDEAAAKETVRRRATAATPAHRAAAWTVLTGRTMWAAAAVVLCGIVFFAFGRLMKEISKTNSVGKQTGIQGEETDDSLQEKFTSKPEEQGEDASVGTDIDGATENHTIVDYNDPAEEDQWKNVVKAWTEQKHFTNAGIPADRITMSAEVLLDLIQETNRDDPEAEYLAICLVTVQDIDYARCNDDGSASFPPITVRIDKIYKSVSWFDLKENDVITTGDNSVWTKREGGYEVTHREVVIPITEVGAQYIVCVMKADPSRRDAERYAAGAKYTLQAHTIPLTGQNSAVSGMRLYLSGSVRLGNGQNAQVPREKIYECMNLEDDVVRCSEELIRMFITGESGE